MRDVLILLGVGGGAAYLGLHALLALWDEWQFYLARVRAEGFEAARFLYSRQVDEIVAARSAHDVAEAFTTGLLIGAQEERLRLQREAVESPLAASDPKELAEAAEVFLKQQQQKGAA
ncbi:MAG TPA: hypothetical protein VD948_08900 [Rhodothermales bacterium]|nr:hypothetical protein [Rhodothermales bacterium]